MMLLLHFLFLCIYIPLPGLGHNQIFKHLNFEGRRTKDIGYWWAKLNPCKVHVDADLRRLTGAAYHKMLEEIATSERSLGHEVPRPPMMAGLYDGSKCVFASTFQGQKTRDQYRHPNMLQIEISRCGHLTAVLDWRRQQENLGLDWRKTYGRITPSLHRYRGHCAEMMAMSRYYREHWVDPSAPRDKWIITVYGSHANTRTGSLKDRQGPLYGPENLCARLKDSNGKEIRGLFSCQNFAKHMRIRYLQNEPLNPPGGRPPPLLPPLKELAGGAQTSRKRPRPEQTSAIGSDSEPESGEIVESKKRKKEVSSSCKESSSRCQYPAVV